MIRRCLSAIVVLAAFLILAAPVLAGGWATIRLDEPPGELPPGEPWQFGFMVLQHDVTPNSDVTPVVRATHLESGDEVTATAAQEGPTGHFVAELTLPTAGEWSWTITPEPFAETSFPALMVGDQREGDASIGTASIFTGSCASPGELTHALGEISAGSIARADQPLVAVSEATIEMPLREMTDAPNAIVVGDTPHESATLACGEISGDLASGELAIPLQPMGAFERTGLAILRPDAERTEVTLYLFALDRPANADTASERVETIEMTDAWLFQPANLEIAAGETLTWFNESSIVHSIALDDQSRSASGLLDPGQSFSFTFDTPGTFHYRCSPHPGMEGTVTVVG